MSYNLHIIDRSNLDEQVAYHPATKTHTTRRQDLEKANSMPRRDVILMNGTRSGSQYLVEVTPTGFTGDVWLLDILTDEQHERVMQFADRMRHNAIDFPPACKLLVITDAPRGWTSV